MILLFCKKLKTVRSEEGSLRDEIPQAGYGAASPSFPHREAIKEKSSQGAKRYLTVNTCKPRQNMKSHSAHPEIANSPDGRCCMYDSFVHPIRFNRRLLRSLL